MTDGFGAPLLPGMEHCLDLLPQRWRYAPQIDAPHMAASTASDGQYGAAGDVGLRPVMAASWAPKGKN